MAEILKFPSNYIKEKAKAKPGEEGALGPIDTYNRISYSISKPAAIVTGVGALAGVPFAVPLFLFAGAVAGVDKLQLEGSKWLKSKLKTMKPGKEYPLAKKSLPKAA